MDSSASPQRQGSLARSTLTKMGIRIGVIIALTTLFSYVHMFRALQTEALLRLERYASERSQREEAIFVLAQDDQVLLKKALEERLQAWEKEDPNALFNSLFKTLPDGTTRSRGEGFDSTKQPGVFIPRGVPLDAELRRRVLAAHDVLVQYGPAYRVRFSTTFITLPEGAVLGYWPEAGTWANELATNYSILEEPFFLIGLPQNNPERKVAWTGVFWDVATNSWLATATTPLDRDNRHVASISHDVLLAELMTRSINDQLIEDAVRMQDAALAHHRVKVERQLAPLPPMLLDKHKVLVILVNLITNARHAMESVPEDQRRLTMKVEPPIDGRIRLEVRDNGTGISPELLTRIFQRGFTTRSEGHGFGLHSSALTAQQLGGSLSVHSDGLGKGATFTLELPYQPTQEAK